MSSTKRNKPRRLDNSGFSLIELMVVLIILGMITAIVTLNAGRFLGKGQKEAAKAQLQNLEGAMQAFRGDMGRFPTTEEGLRALVENPDGSTEWNGPYLSRKEIPKDPWKNDYVYVYPGTHGYDFDLYSKGQDGQAGTSDDINNW